MGGLILVAAFASVREAAKSLVGGLLAQVLVERFPNLSLIGNVSCPTLFIHGEKDSLVPPSHSVALFKQCRARKLLITPPSMEHNTNLFTDASFLAVPAINFFGLPGYQQETPPQMPSRCFEDGRQAFWLRKAAKRKEQQKRDASLETSNPWFFLCGCPTSKAKPAGSPTMEQQPNSDVREYEWEPDKEAGSARRVSNGAGGPMRETAADVATAKAVTLSEDKRDVSHGVDGPWADVQDFREEEIDSKLQFV